jgi:hypothetical protein
LVAEAVEEDLWVGVGFVVGVFVGDEEQVRRGEDECAAEADFDAGDVIEFVVEDGSLVEVAVVVGVLEDEDAVGSGCFPLGIVISLGHPEAAAIVDGVGNGLDDVGLGGEDGGGEAGGEFHGRDGLLGGEGFGAERRCEQEHRGKGGEAFEHGAIESFVAFVANSEWGGDVNP